MMTKLVLRVKGVQCVARGLKLWVLEKGSVGLEEKEEGDLKKPISSF
jgi:hypothetical protein